MESSKGLKRQSRIRRNTDQWQAIIQQYKQSGQTQSEFCAAQSLALSTFHRWYQRLGTSSQPDDVAHEEPVFVELASEDDPITLPTPIPWDVELQLGEDIVLRLRQRC